MPLDPKSAFEALRRVIDPELRRDIVGLGMVKDLAVEGEAVSPEVKLTFGARVRAAPGVDQAALTPGVKNIVLVGAGKGGVGKSTIAVNLAVALQRLGARVGILDADIYGPSLPLLTGTLGQRPGSTDGKRLEPLAAHGVKVMSIGSLVDPQQALLWRGPMVRSEEHTSELQSPPDLVCRLLLEKK